MVNLTSDGKIKAENEQVGRIEFDENRISKIEVDQEYRGQGIGTEAVRQHVEMMEEKGYDYIVTTPATAPKIRHIFEKLGFRRIENPSAYSYIEGAPDEMYEACFVKEL